MQHGSNLNYPVLVTYDGTPAARQGLATAANIARASGDDLNVVLLADTLEEATPLREDVTGWLARQGLSAEFHWLPETTVVTLTEMVKAAENCVLVLGGESPLLRAEAIQELLDSTDCPVMLVR
jgi:nucleotide-binding universal stress UspA family protein